MVVFYMLCTIEDSSNIILNYLIIWVINCFEAVTRFLKVVITTFYHLTITPNPFKDVRWFYIGEDFIEFSIG